MVAAVVAKFQFVGFSTERQRKQLVAEADAEDRQWPCGAVILDKLFDGLDCITDSRRVARSVREKDAVRVELDYLIGCCSGLENGYPAPCILQHPQDVGFDAIVECCDMVSGILIFKSIIFTGGNSFNQIPATHFRALKRLLFQYFVVGFKCGNNASHGTFLTYFANKLAGIDTGKTHNPGFFKTRVEAFGSFIVAVDTRYFMDDEGRSPYFI